MPAYQLIDIHVARSDGRVVVHVSGELHLMSSGPLTERLSAIAPTPRTVLDLSEVSFIDSTGLRALWLFQQTRRRDGRRLFLQSPSPAVRRLLDVTGLTSVFDFDG
jgi:anti-sigma B factor antagonist